MGSIRVFLCLDSKCAYVSHFYPLEVVGRCDETQRHGGHPAVFGSMFSHIRATPANRMGGGDNQYLIGFT